MSRPVRVLHVLGSSRPGGTESVVRELLANASRDRLVASVCIIGESGSMDAELIELADKVVALQEGQRGYASSALRFADMMRRGRFDVVHFHAGGRSLKYVARLLGCRAIITHFHSITEAGTDLLRSGDPGLGRLLERQARGSDWIIACSDWMAALLRRSLPRHSDRIERVYNGVDLSRFRPRAESAGGSFVAGFAGRLVRQKGLSFLLDAAELMKETAPDVRFVIAGGGPSRAALENRVNEKSLSNVQFLGEVHDIRQVMSSFDVTLMPSEWEPFGIVAVESMAMKIPVIGSSVDGLPEVIENGSTGFVVPFGDAPALVGAILRLRDSNDLRARLGENGRRRVEAKFDARIMAGEVERIYMSVLGWD